jgi:hypothetical protein
MFRSIVLAVFASSLALGIALAAPATKSAAAPAK